MKKRFLILVILFLLTIIGYIIFPLLITQNMANRYNERKFYKTKALFSEVIDTAIKICDKGSIEQQECNFRMCDFPETLQMKLKRKGVYQMDIFIKKDMDVIEAKFYTEHKWMNRVLNNVTIEFYSQQKKGENFDYNETNASMYSIFLGEGWFIYVETDFI